jgi:hypothetical protein
MGLLMASEGTIQCKGGSFYGLSCRTGHIRAESIWTNAVKNVELFYTNIILEESGNYLEALPL